MALVVVSHQAATGHSLLPEILATTTPMPVHEVTGETGVEPNQVYVAPRGRSLRLHDGVLGVGPSDEPARVPFAIDSFFRTLAHDQGGSAAGIILSGTGSDGTLGLAAIRAVGGLCLVQSPETAEFDGMPASAIAASAADFALPVGAMSERLLAHAEAARSSASPEVSSSAIDGILALIHVREGRDFSAYKRDTLLRRIRRRMDLHRIRTLAGYTRYLAESDEEIEALWRDWLIGVTGFFRDPEAFEALAEVGLPPLLAARQDDPRLRVWVPGCGTGEEAYSIAIVAIEACEALGAQCELQLFGTDLDPVAIETARQGRYAKSIASSVGKERLDRFFVEEEGGYRVRKFVRDRIVFAVQDVLHDPPFTRVDAISCRNLLIYLLPSAQQALISIFHYSLNPDGLLLLGSSEDIGGHPELFARLDKRWKLFRHLGSAAGRPAVRWAARVKPATGIHAADPLVERHKLGLAETLRRCLADRFAPPAVIIDLRGQIHQTHGRVGPYLELAPGRANLNLVEMARPGLRAPLVAALNEIKRSDVASVQKDLPWQVDGRSRGLRLHVARIDGHSHPKQPFFLVSFELAPDRGRRRPPRVPSSKRGRLQYAAQVEEDLQQVRRELEVTVAELQAVNEELASSSEEVQSANEELQSNNEELQTSKEETQSLNEELQTVNAELAEKLRGLARANDDLENLVSNIEIATIFLDERLRVKRFTPQAKNVARLIDTDVGRPLADLAMLVGYPELLTDAANVLATLRPLEKQAPAPGGIWYTVRIRPYRTARNAIEGLVVTFIDITEAKHAERTQAAQALAESIVDAVREPLLVLSTALRVVRGNRSFYASFRLEPAQVEGQSLESLGARHWSDVRLHGLLEATLQEGAPFEDFELVADFERLGRRRLILSGRPVTVGSGNEPVLVLMGIHDAGDAPAVVRREGEDA